METSRYTPRLWSQTFSALSVEPLNGDRSVTDTTHVAGTFSALSVEPLNGGANCATPQ